MYNTYTSPYNINAKRTHFDIKVKYALLNCHSYALRHKKHRHRCHGCKLYAPKFPLHCA